MKIYKLFLSSHLPLETLGSDDTLSLVYIILRLPFSFLFILVLSFLYLFFLLLNLGITQVCPWSFSVSSLIFVTVRCILHSILQIQMTSLGFISVNYDWKLISLFLLVAQSVLNLLLTSSFLFPSIVNCLPCFIGSTITLFFTPYSMVSSLQLCSVFHCH